MNETINKDGIQERMQLHAKIDRKIDEFEKLTNLQDAIYSAYNNKLSEEAKIVVAEIDEKLDKINKFLSDAVETLCQTNK